MWQKYTKNNFPSKFCPEKPNRNQSAFRSRYTSTIHPQYKSGFIFIELFKPKSMLQIFYSYE
jgi:hypothetical protein